MEQIPKESQKTVTGSGPDGSETQSKSNVNKPVLESDETNLTNVNGGSSHNMPPNDCVKSCPISTNVENVDSATNGEPSPSSATAPNININNNSNNQLHTGSGTSNSKPQNSDKLDTRARGKSVGAESAKAIAKALPIPGRCQLYLARKRRYCRSVPNVGKDYCVEHSVEATDRKRIQCPLDPKHTCYEDQLANHLKKCNARREAQPIFYVENINAGNIEDGEGSKVAVSTVEPEEIKLMIAKINQLYEDKVKSLKEEILCHATVQEEINKPTNGPAAQKHLKQQASLVGHVDKHGLLHDECCYIEFGAGKAGLSHWVQRAQESCDNTKFVLVDKSSVRYKMDVFHRGEDQGPDFERLRIDIQHLDLNKVPSLIDNRLPLVGLGKHLCGGATDLMLRCLMQTVQETTNTNQKNPYVEGLVLALCCHHRCDWRSFVGKQTMRDWGVGPREFSLMTCMTSWATCATRTFLQKLKERELETGSNTSQQEEHGPVDAEDDKPYNHPRYGSLTPEEREEVGFKCKKLLDMARVYYLREHGFTAELLVYAQLEHTLENVVLVANNSKQPEPHSAEPTAGVVDP